MTMSKERSSRGKDRLKEVSCPNNMNRNKLVLYDPTKDFKVHSTEGKENEGHQKGRERREWI